MNWDQETSEIAGETLNEYVVCVYATEGIRNNVAESWENIYGR